MAGEKRLRNIAILLADGVGTRVLILAGLASPRLPDTEESPAARTCAMTSGLRRARGGT
jgi:hypothetical protein